MKHQMQPSQKDSHINQTCLDTTGMICAARRAPNCSPYGKQRSNRIYYRKQYLFLSSRILYHNSPSLLVRITLTPALPLKKKSINFLGEHIPDNLVWSKTVQHCSMLRQTRAQLVGVITRKKSVDHGKSPRLISTIKC